MLTADLIERRFDQARSAELDTGVQSSSAPAPRRSDGICSGRTNCHPNKLMRRCTLDRRLSWRPRLGVALPIEARRITIGKSAPLLLARSPDEFGQTGALHVGWCVSRTAVNKTCPPPQLLIDPPLLAPTHEDGSITVPKRTKADRNSLGAFVEVAGEVSSNCQCL